MHIDAIKRICVAIGRKNVDDALAAARQVAGLADVIEIRLDTLDEPAIIPFTTGLAQPLLFTHRPVWEGGHYDGPEGDRIALLCEAIYRHAAFVDLELQSPESSYASLRTAIQGSDTQLILSSHNFTLTPSRNELLTILQKIQERGADVAKIITMAHDHHDVLRVLQLQEDAAQMDIPLIAFCMGRAGVVSRLATLELGGFMTYCTVNSDEATAPGQIPVLLMRDLFQTLFVK